MSEYERYELCICLVHKQTLSPAHTDTHAHMPSGAVCWCWWLFLTGAQGGSPTAHHPFSLFFLFFCLPSFFRLLICIIGPPFIGALFGFLSLSPEFMTASPPPPPTFPRAGSSAVDAGSVINASFYFQLIVVLSRGAPASCSLFRARLHHIPGGSVIKSTCSGEFQGFSRGK